MSEINVGIIESGLSPEERLFAAATVHNFQLDPNRAAKLIENAKLKLLPENINNNIFEEDGLYIKRPMVMSVSGIPLSRISRLDFLPQVNKASDFIANPHPQRGKTTQITLMGINAFQDFVLMADAGLIQKPERFYGNTNPAMARIARRIGFVETPRFADGITASYEDVSKRVFSPEILDIQQRLTQRQQTAAPSVGSLTLV